MPQTGFCADMTCPKELTQLYECHCCNCFICLNHLLEHVQIARQHEERLNFLREELISISTRLKNIVKMKLRQIENENFLINRVNSILETTFCSVEEIENLSEEIHRAILSNPNEEETIFNVESSLAEKTKTSADLDRRFEGKFDDSILTDDDDQPVISNTTPGIFQLIKDEADDDVVVQSSPPPRKSLPLQKEFHSKAAKRSTRLGSKDKSNKFDSFSNKVTIVNDRSSTSPTNVHQDPKISRLVDENDVLVHHRRKFPCPLSTNMINLFGCPPKSSRRIPCQSKLCLGSGLIAHLSRIHNIRPRISKPMVKTYEENLLKMISSNDPRIDFS